MNRRPKVPAEPLPEMLATWSPADMTCASAGPKPAGNGMLLTRANAGNIQIHTRPPVPARNRGGRLSKPPIAGAW